MGRAVGRPERRELAAGLEISRVVTGLWQVADMERDGGPLDPERGARTPWPSTRPRASTRSTWPTTTAAPS